MNEAELHVLKQRMYQGKLNKARRGELFAIPPIGSIRLASGEWAMDPDGENPGSGSTPARFGRLSTAVAANTTR